MAIFVLQFYFFYLDSVIKVGLEMIMNFAKLCQHRDHEWNEHD